MQHHDECLLLAPPCQANVPTLDLKPGHQAFIFLPVDLHAAQHGTDGLYRIASLQWGVALAGCCELWSLGGRLAARSGLREADLLHGLAKVALAMLYRHPTLPTFTLPCNSSASSSHTGASVCRGVAGVTGQQGWLSAVL